MFLMPKRRSPLPPLNTVPLQRRCPCAAWLSCLTFTEACESQARRAEGLSGGELLWMSAGKADGEVGTGILLHIAGMVECVCVCVCV